MDIAIIFAFGAMIFWGLGDFLIQRTIYRLGRIETLFLITFASSVFLVPLILPELKTLSYFHWFMLLILGFIVLLGSHIHFLALEKGKLAVVEMILGLELPLTILLGIIILKEKLTLSFVLITSIVFIGIILVSINFNNLKAKNFLEKGALLAFVSAFLVALINFLTALAAQDLSPLTVISLPWLLVCLFTLAWIIRKRRLASLVREAINFWQLTVSVVIVDILAWLFYAAAVADNELSIIIAITESFIVIAFLLGIFYNKEKVSRWQIVGAALALLGSVSIAFLHNIM